MVCRRCPVAPERHAVRAIRGSLSSEILLQTIQLVRNLDLVDPDIADNRLEVVADGLPLFGGAQLAIDTTLVSALRADGTAERRAADHDGVAAGEARRRKARTYPELAGLHGRARLVVLAVEVAGR